jgi:hypothetical protein
LVPDFCGDVRRGRGVVIGADREQACNIGEKPLRLRAFGDSLLRPLERDGVGLTAVWSSIPAEWIDEWRASR